MKKPALVLATAICLCALPSTSATAAALLFDTATGTPLQSGLVVDDYFWPMHRFQVISPTVISSVGGFFDDTTAGPLSIFAAVVGLSGPTDLPDSLDLTTADVLGTTTFPLTPSMGAFSGHLTLALAPGWYALAFGTGKFGADSVVGVDVIMPSLALDLDPQLPFTAIRAGNPYATPPQFLNQQASPEFFATPEPDMLSLVAFGLAALLVTRRQKVKLAGAGGARCQESVELKN